MAGKPGCSILDIVDIHSVKWCQPIQKLEKSIPIVTHHLLGGK